jgi:aspartyl protease family protein
MKKFLKILIPLAAIIFPASGAIAQEAEGCFMINSSNQMLDLSQLCGNSTKKASTNPKVFQAKIKRRESGVPVIEVTFNAKHKFEMLLDTGASRTMITQNIADALGVVPVSTEKSIVASGDVVESSVGRVASIKVGNAIVNEPTVLIGAVPLLGQNFFGEYDVIIRKDVVEFHAR